MHEMRRGCVEVLQWWIQTVKIQNPNGRVVAKSSFPIATRKCKSGWRTDTKTLQQGSFVDKSCTGAASVDPTTVFDAQQPIL